MASCTVGRRRGSGTLFAATITSSTGDSGGSSPPGGSGGSPPSGGLGGSVGGRSSGEYLTTLPARYSVGIGGTAVSSTAGPRLTCGRDSAWLATYSGV